MTRYATSDGAFELDSMPGQSQVAVCHSFMIRDDARGVGKAHQLKAFQKKVLQCHQYDFAICSISAGNAAQRRVLETAGWKKLSEFRNKRSCETTEIWGNQV